MSDLSSKSWPLEVQRFARDECPTQPVTAALCRALAQFDDLDVWMAEVPAAQARVNLLLAAVHERVLAGAGAALADYFPSVGGWRAPDVAFVSHVWDLLQREHAVLRHHLRQRATQTNETGRSAVLRLALDLIADPSANLSATSRLALFDFGASAGLNLGVDADDVTVGSRRRGAGTRLDLHCDWRGGAIPPAQDWTLEARAGTDLAPIDPSLPSQRRWLEACTWPDDTQRLARLRQALAWGDEAVRAGVYQVHASDDGLDVLAGWLRALPKGVQPVLLNSWVLAYFDAPQRAHYRQGVQALVDQHGLLALCAEPHSHHPWSDGLPLAHEASATLWTLHDRNGTQPLFWSHPHGAWARRA